MKAGKLLLFCLGFCLALPLSARDWKVRSVRSLRHALEAARPGDRILLRPGTYRLDASLVLQDKDSLTLAPLRPGRKVEIKGGAAIPRRSLKPAPGLGPRVRRADLSPWGFTGILPKGHGRPIGPAWSEVFADGTPLRLSRWPDEGWLPMDSVVRTGFSQRFDGAGFPGDPAQSLVKPSADPTISGAGKDSGGPRRNSLGIIAFHDDRPLGWARPQAGCLQGCFRYGWADELVRILAITPEKTLEVRDTTYYGFGVRPGERFQRWCIRNVPEEIDEPGEYALDEEERALYLIPPEGARQVEISLLGEPLLRISGCRGITVRGLSFSCSRGDGIEIRSSEDVRLETCVLHNLGERAVTIDAACRRCGLASCQVHDTGAGGILLDGGDRRDIIRGDNYVEDCILHDYNRIEKSLRPAVTMKGLGNRVSHCEIFRSATHAILMNGNDQLIERCDIHQVCQDVEDCGAIYYGRNPSERGSVIRWNYIHDIIVPWNVRAIYHDDGACACEVYGNIISHISSPPVQIGGGSDIVYHDNIFMHLDCAAVKTDARLQTWGKDRLKAHRVYVAQVDGPAFRAHYPEFASYYEGDPSEPRRNAFYNNVLYDVKWAFERVDWSSRDYNDILEGSANYFSEMHGNWKTADNPGFKDPDNPQAGFVPDPPLKKHIPDFHLKPLLP